VPLPLPLPYQTPAAADVTLLSTLHRIAYLTAEAMWRT